MGDTGSRIDLCAAADVAPGTVLKVEEGELDLAVFNVDGEFFVTDDHCTHGPGSAVGGLPRRSRHRVRLPQRRL